MDEFPQECVVYYLDGNVFSAARFRSRIKKIDERIQNAREDIMLLKTTQEALLKIEALLRHMCRLAALSAGDATELDRDLLDKQFQSLKKDIEDIASSAGYNGVNLLDGSFGDLNEIIAALGEAIL